MGNLLVAAQDFSRKFAEKKVKEKVYQKRNQTNQDKIYEDCLCSKLAEWAVYHWLCGFSSYFRPDTPPLMKILDRPNWSADLQNSHLKIAVKNCPLWSHERFGLSWTFQSGGKGVGHHDPILDIEDKNYKVVFVEQISVVEYNIYGTSDTQTLKTGNAYQFIDGRDLGKYKGIKLFVHADLIDESIIKRIDKVIDINDIPFNA